MRASCNLPVVYSTYKTLSMQSFTRELQIVGKKKVLQTACKNLSLGPFLNPSFDFYLVQSPAENTNLIPCNALVLFSLYFM